MKKYSYLKRVQVLSCGVLFAVLGCSEPENQVIRFKNGKWFDGVSFKENTFYSVNGVLQRRTIAAVDTTINLKGAFMVPPFGDAHTHNLSDYNTLNETEAQYISDGVFYVQVLTNHSSRVDSLRARFKPKNRIDVKYANGGITATLGHPYVAFETAALGLHWSAMFYQRERIMQSRLVENDAYWFMDRIEDVDVKWDSIMNSQPDLIKIYLINSQDQEKLQAGQQIGNFGLHPDVARYVVTKAHQADLPVYAHVENAYDFRVGLDIGVDGFAHLPGYSWDGKKELNMYLLTDADIQRAIEQNTVITPTVSFGRVYATNYDKLGNSSLDSIRFTAVNEFLRVQLNRLHRAGFVITLGADQTGKTSKMEAQYILEDLKALSNLDVLQMLAVETPRSIYPDRNIGKLANGYEASFLALQGNPLVNWAYTDSINLRVKQGFLIDSTIQP